MIHIVYDNGNYWRLQIFYVRYQTLCKYLFNVTLISVCGKNVTSISDKLVQYLVCVIPAGSENYLDYLL
jgi:hypothetical protein